MSNLFLSIALALLPMGADVTHTDSGQCATDTRGIVQVCTDASDYQMINIGDRATLPGWMSSEMDNALLN
jgi:hypothetical protein